MYQAPRGTSDILPEDQPYWRFIENVISEVTKIYGYRRIDTPVFEDTGLFNRSVGQGTDIVEKEMYTFEDKGGNSITLRPEGTAPVCRAYLEHGMQNLPQPVKMYYQAPIFRYERPQAGRLREHHQFGCECVGDADPAADAEVIEMAWRFYNSLGIKNLSLQLNSIGDRLCRPAYLNILKEYYTSQSEKLCADCKTRLAKNPLRLLDCKQPSCQAIADAAPASADHLCPECQAHFNSLQKYLKSLNIPYSINHRLVRGLDYYTRTVFEFQPEEEKGQSSIGAGGRYDNLIEELGGKPTSAIGFGIGIERVVLNLKKQNISVPAVPQPKIIVATLGDAARDAGVKLASDLRRAGISAVTSAGGKSLKAQLRQADALGARYAVIIGEDEVKAGTVTLRDMTNASQETLAVQELAARIL
ncbi:MAG TPA: histidine--tRNA ligase [Dehalococcoidales bacterium]|nr:histidine--tRNA ligase [Dehalococcoidales bacterium]